MYGNSNRALILAQSSIFIALITLSGQIQIPIPITPVPITAQTFFIILTCAIMKRYAIIPVGIYVLLGLLGLPVFATTSGIGELLTPSGGFIIGFVVMSLITGFIFERESIIHDVIACIVFNIGCYCFGVVGFMINAHTGLCTAILACVVPFLIGDTIKTVIAELINIRLRNINTNK